MSMSTPIDQLPQPTSIDPEYHDMTIKPSTSPITQEIRRKTYDNNCAGGSCDTFTQVTSLFTNKEFLLVLVLLFLSNIDTTNTYFRMLPGVNSINNATLKIFMKALLFALLFWVIKVYLMKI